ncbi:sensor histidine kinase [Bifidobacterium eulemuris]|uniref:histidine kinase n=1 Tax=Bifidobacterium eulemuris TaxID=1765219 RepID=A0A261GDN4_9BIFI|nr:histidine kinase [Bifidobacterium eulemuris]OZG69363.1 two-component sensor kinase [Bifidobacterium eulemuris]QOL31148.1 sensor histidine kinase [Bifidobacterium eulemuris]
MTNSMAWWRRARRWMVDNPLFMDTLSALTMMLFVGVTGASMTDGTGALFEQTPSSTAFWTIVVMVPLAFRRRWPQASALAFVALALLQLVFGPSLVLGDFSALVMLYSVIVYGDPKHTHAFLVVAAVMSVLTSVVGGFSIDAGPLFMSPPVPSARVCRSSTGAFEMTADCASTMVGEIIGFGVAITLCVVSVIVLAYWQRARLYTLRLMREREQALRASEQEEQHIAALAERARIARDMHDVVAHTLSIIIIQSDGGRYAGAHDTAVARSTMETIRHESQRALGDMRRLLTVFGWSASAGYGDIESLIDQSRTAAGDDWTLERHIVGVPAPRRLSEDASMAAYRLVQEALTNVRKYALASAGGPAARAHVRVDVVEHWEANGVTLQVLDDGRGVEAERDGHQPGYGLVGMRERVEAAGGSVAAGPRPDSRGFEVTAFLPYAPVESETSSTSAEASPTAIETSPAAVETTPNAFSSRHPDRNAPFPRHPERSETQSRDLLPIPIPLPLSAAAQVLRSEPIDQPDSLHGERFNWIERLSQWTERHYLAMDALGTLLLLALLSGTSFTSSTLLGTNSSIAGSTAYVWFVSGGTILPLMFRRRFPDAVALVVAAVSAFQLIFLPTVMFTNVFALVALYSAVLYERRHSWKRYAVISVIVSLLFGAKVWSTTVPIFSDSEAHGDFSLAYALYRLATGQRELFAGMTSYQRLMPVMYMMIVMLCCAATIAGALWSRSRGSNALVLQAREDALRAERAKQRVLAANMERDRISANIQTEVTATLTSVSARAEAGLAMLDEAAARGEEPSSEAIVSAFEAIGHQGREALARMRQLLRVLRETGFSDEAHTAEAENPELQLAPAASLDEQLRGIAETEPNTGHSTQSA